MAKIFATGDSLRLSLMSETLSVLVDVAVARQDGTAQEARNFYKKKKNKEQMK
jgi:hypothetical protein